MNDFEGFLKSLQARISKGLPGVDAHQKMVPPQRKLPQRTEAITYNPKVAGVMALLYPHQSEPHLVFTVRQDYPGVHSGQISFPGGKQELHEPDTWETALRETFEEVRAPIAQVALIAPLTSLYIPVSNFLVDPYLAALPTRPDFVPEAAEVKQILELPVRAFLQPQVLQTFEVPGYKGAITPCYKIDGHIIWGATAMIVSEILHLLEGEF